MQMTQTKSVILNRFSILYKKYNDTIPTLLLKSFIETNFKLHTLNNWIPPDFKNHPPIIDYVQDTKYK